MCGQQFHCLRLFFFEKGIFWSDLSNEEIKFSFLMGSDTTIFVNI